MKRTPGLYVTLQKGGKIKVRSGISVTDNKIHTNFPRADCAGKGFLKRRLTR